MFDAWRYCRARRSALVMCLCVVRTCGATSAVWPNMTAFDCEPAREVVAGDLGNCSITVRGEGSAPAEGATQGDFELYAAAKLGRPGKIFGGPVHWYVTFASCAAGRWGSAVELETPSPHASR